MAELAKLKKIILNLATSFHQEVFLVLDASTGQNAIAQAKEFIASTNVTGLVITKLDGSAKGGVLVAIVDQLKIPIRYICVGEKIDDIHPFDASDFAQQLFS